MLMAVVQKQLEEERRAHARTKEQADVEILQLRAMVARRDAELEMCATHSGHHTSLFSSLSAAVVSTSHCAHSGCAHTRGHSTLSWPRTRTREAEKEERLLSQSQMRQRMLEREVAYLRTQVSLHICTK